MLNVYCISGLGADRRAFDNIKLDSKYTIHYIDWIEPQKNESIESYALRMATSIDITQDFVLIGLSFGGIISIEISKFLPSKKVILISSISNKNELPWYFSLSGKLKLHRLGFVSVIKKSNRILFWFFGTKSHKLKAYLREMIAQTSEQYLQWSLDQITSWKQEKKPDYVFHIHGKKDKLFPISCCQADMTVDKGSHFMIVTHGRLISEKINTILNLL